MSATPLDGKALAKRIRDSVKIRAAAFNKKFGRRPLLCIVSRDNERMDRSTASYHAEQLKACEEVGISWTGFVADWPNAETAARCLNEQDDRDGFILDLPLNPSVDLETLLALLPAEKDVEAVTPASFGRFMEIKTYAEVENRGLAVPCTALAVVELAREAGVPLAGKRAVVLGRSNIVGKPAAHLLTCLDMTVTVCHSKTADLPALAREADVLVAAMGKPKMVKADWIKPGAIVVDAGINSVDGKLCGDVDPKAAERAGWITPVPGGVGPVTTAMLLSNTVMLAERRAKALSLRRPESDAR